ncbi:hypothetical protein [Prevotella fusca]|uniref:hypothetical protein n=1 Tax=Prevotella fusca TaxID=589436 RepID=UPI000B0D23E4|nr:hypothetical protein [Prevotella fusca]
MDGETWIMFVNGGESLAVDIGLSAHFKDYALFNHDADFLQLLRCVQRMVMFS